MRERFIHVQCVRIDASNTHLHARLHANVHPEPSAASGSAVAVGCTKIAARDEGQPASAADGLGLDGGGIATHGAVGETRFDLSVASAGGLLLNILFLHMASGFIVGSSKGGLGCLLVGGPCRGHRGGASDAREEQECKGIEHRLHSC